MFNIQELENSINFTMSTELKLVDRLVKNTRAFLDEHGRLEFSSIKLVLRELLINAIEHGNRNLQHKTVKCKVECVSPCCCQITVSNEGDGFDYEKLEMVLPGDPTKMRSRGFPLINALSDSIHFSDGGRTVTANITIEKETDFEVVQDDVWQVIVPSGDITASTADKLRSLLNDSVSAGNGMFRFDFKNVQDIDSVGISSMIVLARMLKNGRFNMTGLEIINAANDIVRLFQMINLDSLYKIKAKPSAE